MTNLKMYLWVTSDCNLACPLCNQKYARNLHKGYNMSMDELRFFIASSIDRGIHYFTIELMGGEPTMWPNLEEAVNLIYDSKVCDHITLATNGNTPEKILKLESLLYYWVVSRTQATPEQVARYMPFSYKITFNKEPHRAEPNRSIPDTLPAVCCVTQDKWRTPYESVLYLKGKVYYCHFAPALERWTPRDDLSCDFKDDFVKKFLGKKYDKKICTYCTGNNKVWEQLPRGRR